MCVQEIFIEISLFEPIQLILHFLIRTKKKKKKKNGAKATKIVYIPVNFPLQA